MSLKYTMEVLELLDDASVNGEAVVRLFEGKNMWKQATQQ